jgi:hypothetical protein
MLLDGPALNVLSLESLRLPGRRLGIIGMRWLELGWLELGWLEWVCEGVSPKTRILPSWSGVVYGTRSLLFLPLLLEDSLESYLDWAII